ncbi:BQ5605_C007g04705 [Microbotryum silenes-dioicae]|uniref:BQ5605_C007g04705 protein n=1 Tax=Microbotryum silenes-dioicae TaxID=796604 RepID=A0A2X0MC62_9BASI|nr:BQ5605_C007g04705 [Microbotryum silenes-dioicae]
MIEGVGKTLGVAGCAGRVGVIVAAKAEVFTPIAVGGSLVEKGEGGKRIPGLRTIGTDVAVDLGVASMGIDTDVGKVGRDSTEGEGIARGVEAEVTVLSDELDALFGGLRSWPGEGGGGSCKTLGNDSARVADVGNDGRGFLRGLSQSISSSDSSLAAECFRFDDSVSARGVCKDDDGGTGADDAFTVVCCTGGDSSRGKAELLPSKLSKRRRRAGD